MPLDLVVQHYTQVPVRRSIIQDDVIDEKADCKQGFEVPAALWFVITASWTNVVLVNILVNMNPNTARTPILKGQVKVTIPELGTHMIIALVLNLNFI